MRTKENNNLCEEIKKNIDLADYVRSCGITLTKHGKNDLKGLCPFHDDTTPSLVITPSKQLFNCPVCNTGGSVIDFTAKIKKISIKDAIKELSKLRTSQPEKTICENSCSFVAELSPERSNELLERVISFYEKTFADSADGRKYFEKRGITDAGLFTKHRIGYADGSLLKALPKKGKILEELEILGVLVKLPDGNYIERFRHCAVFPTADIEGDVTTLYGRSVSGRKHVYLPGRPTGLFNASVIRTYPETVLVESCIDALSLEMAGVDNVVSIQGTNGLSDKDIELFKSCGGRKVTLLLDGDRAGRSASTRLREKLSEHFTVTDIPLPEDMDPNEYLIKHGSEDLLSLLAGPSAAKKENLISVNQCPSVVQKENGFIITCGLRNYEIIGLEKKPRSLKATVRVMKAGRLHVDTIDF
jgi:DNA primase catalytic core